MIVVIVSLILSVGAALCLYFFTPMYPHWEYFWVPILAFIGFFVACFLLWLLFAFILSKIFVRKDKDYGPGNKIAAFIAREAIVFIALMAKVRIKKIGFEKLDKKQRYVIVHNHVSMWDEMAMFATEGKIHQIFITKPGNLKIPLAGDYMRWMGYLPINREDPMEGFRVINKAAKIGRENNVTVVIAPEGTRSKDLKLHEFKGGSFHLAFKAECPLVVMAVQNTPQIHKKWPYWFTTVYLTVLEVIPYEEYKDKKGQELANYCHGIVEKYLAETGEQNRKR